jgi:hypothetical protein
LEFKCTGNLDVAARISQPYIFIDVVSLDNEVIAIAPTPFAPSDASEATWFIVPLCISMLLILNNGQ